MRDTARKMRSGMDRTGKREIDSGGVLSCDSPILNLFRSGLHLADDREPRTTDGDKSIVLGRAASSPNNDRPLMPRFAVARRGQRRACSRSMEYQAGYCLCIWLTPVVLKLSSSILSLSFSLDTAIRRLLFAWLSRRISKRLSRRGHRAPIS